MAPPWSDLETGPSRVIPLKAGVPARTQYWSSIRPHRLKPLMMKDSDSTAVSFRKLSGFGRFWPLLSTSPPIPRSEREGEGFP